MDGKTKGPELSQGVGVIAWVAVAALLALAGCQKVSEPVPILTQNQWQRVHEHILDEAPEVDYEVGANWAGKVELIGFDVEPQPIEAGEEITVTWYWRVLESMEDRWEIFVHLDRGAERQNLDHEAIDGLFTALYWEPGQIIRDRQTVELAPRIGSGSVNVYAGFWRRVDNERLPISDPGRGTIQEDGRLLIGSVEARRSVVSLEAPHREGDIRIDGRLNERDWRRAPQSEPFVHPNDGSEVSGASTQVRALWDAEALYVAMSANDSDVWATYADDDASLWEEEVLEVFLDPLGDGRNYVEIQVNPLGAVFDAVFERADGRDSTATAEREHDLEGMEIAVSLNPRDALDDRDDTDRYWRAEFRIPWSSLPDFGDTASSGDVIRANFYRYDRPADGPARTVAWSPVFGGVFHQPDKFGEIRLTGEPPEPPEPSPGEDEGTGQGARGEREGRTQPDRIRRIEGRTLQLVQPPQLPQQLRPVGTSR